MSARDVPRVHTAARVLAIARGACGAGQGCTPDHRANTAEGEGSGDGWWWMVVVAAWHTYVEASRDPDEDEVVLKGNR